MPKIRALKPAFFTDEDVVEVCPLARLLFAGLWCWACDNGHMEDKPKQIKLRILPADDCDVDALLDELARQVLIVRESGWVTIPTLNEHQRPDRRYFVRCAFPGCSDTDAAEEATKSARFGNHRRWHEGRGIVDPECEFCPPEPVAEDTQPPQEDASGPHRVHDEDTTRPRRAPIVSSSWSRRVHVPDGDGDGDGDGDSDGSESLTRATPTKARTPRAARAQAIPADWMPSPEVVEAVRVELPGLDTRAEHRKFTDHFIANGKPMKDWNAAWRNWMRRANEYASKSGRPPTRNPSGIDWDAAMRRAAERTPR